MGMRFARNHLVGIVIGIVAYELYRKRAS